MKLGVDKVERIYIMNNKVRILNLVISKISKIVT